jgi:hypothetical protein
LLENSIGSFFNTDMDTTNTHEDDCIDSPVIPIDISALCSARVESPLELQFMPVEPPTIPADVEATTASLDEREYLGSLVLPRNPSDVRIAPFEQKTTIHANHGQFPLVYQSTESPSSSPPLTPDSQSSGSSWRPIRYNIENYTGWATTAPPSSTITPNTQDLKSSRNNIYPLSARPRKLYNVPQVSNSSQIPPKTNTEGIIPYLPPRPIYCLKSSYDEFEIPVALYRDSIEDKIPIYSPVELLTSAVYNPYTSSEVDIPSYNHYTGFENITESPEESFPQRMGRGSGIRDEKTKASRDDLPLTLSADKLQELALLLPNSPVICNESEYSSHESLPEITPLRIKSPKRGIPRLIEDTQGRDIRCIIPEIVNVPIGTPVPLPPPPRPPRPPPPLPDPSGTECFSHWSSDSTSEKEKPKNLQTRIQTSVLGVVGKARKGLKKMVTNEFDTNTSSKPPRHKNFHSQSDLQQQLKLNDGEEDDFIAAIWPGPPPGPFTDSNCTTPKKDGGELKKISSRSSAGDSGNCSKESKKETEGIGNNNGNGNGFISRGNLFMSPFSSSTSQKKQEMKREKLKKKIKILGVVSDY